MATSPEQDATRAFAELHTISNFSFLRGASHPEELVRTAHALGYRAIAITDECSVAGVVKAHLAARDLDIKLIVGSEFRIPGETGDIHLVLLGTRPTRLRSTSRKLVTLARRRAPKGDYSLDLKDLRHGLDGCLALWDSRSEFVRRPAFNRPQNQRYAA